MQTQARAKVFWTVCAMVLMIRLEDGHDMIAIADALAQARSNNNGKPTFIECKTLIGKGIPEVAGTAAGHGEGGAKYAESAR